MTIAPIRRAFPVKAPPAKAFQLFTAGMERWWPKTHTTGKNPFEKIVMEPHVDGRWYEVDADGAETRWGKVLVWDPPQGLTLAWQLDASFTFDPDLITEVELTFAGQADGSTLVGFEHRNLERLGDSAATLADMLGNGWPGILDLFAASAAEPADQETAQ
jgi:hypothetical protein